MIASVVVTLSTDTQLRQQMVDEISSRPELELGPWTDADRRLPVTIESASRREMEDITDWLRMLVGVVLVDVVFVHFEDGEVVETRR